MSYVVKLSKENFKFSGSHFTIFNNTDAERLHGHNYYVGVEVGLATIDAKIGMAFDFNTLKPIIKKICERLDEKVLIPTLSPYLKITNNGKQTEVMFAAKKYSLPADDVEQLSLVNITSEELSRYVAEELKKHWEFYSKVDFLSVDVQETRGQSVTFITEPK